MFTERKKKKFKTRRKKKKQPVSKLSVAPLNFNRALSMRSSNCLICESTSVCIVYNIGPMRSCCDYLVLIHYFSLILHSFYSLSCGLWVLVVAAVETHIQFWFYEREILKSQ